METILFAVNGTLMRGFYLNKNLLDVNAIFVRTDSTAPIYRLWSIGDSYPAMLQDEDGGASIEVEIWELSAQGLVVILQQEPPGLTIGKIELLDGSKVMGVLGEPYICQGQREITSWGGWRNYLKNFKD